MNMLNNLALQRKDSSDSLVIPVSTVEELKAALIGLSYSDRITYGTWSIEKGGTSEVYVEGGMMVRTHKIWVSDHVSGRAYKVVGTDSIAVKQIAEMIRLAA